MTTLDPRALEDADAIESALKVLRDNGIDIASPRDGDLSDLEQEQFNAFSDACRAYAALSQPRAGEPVDKPYAYEFGRSNGDDTYSVFIERSLPAKPHPDWPVTPLYASPQPANPTQVTDAARAFMDLFVEDGADPPALTLEVDPNELANRYESLSIALANPAQVTDDSPAALINGVANEIHNLACDRQNDEPLLNRLADFRTRLWDVAAAIGAGRSSEPEFETAPDNGTPAEVLAYVLDCARRWVPEARIIGNARAGDIERAIAAIGAGPQPALAVKGLMDAQIEHMVQQFLRWKLPEDFSPDGGVQFVKRTDYGHTFEPVGTNLFDYRQAKAMVQHMLEGVPAIGTGEPSAARSLHWIDVLREWFGGERYARDYEYLDANYSDHARRVAAYAASLSQPHPADERVVEALRKAANIAFDEMFAVTGAPVARAVQQKILALSAKEGR